MAFFQCSQLVVYFLQFIILVTFGYDAPSGLKPELVVTAYEGTDGDGLVQIAVQSDEADATSVSPRLCGSISLMSCMAFTLGAPLRVPAGKVSMNVLIGSASLSSVPLTLLTR